MVIKDTGVSIDTNSGSLSASETIATTPKKVWAMLVAHHQISEWWGNYVSIEPHVGGNFEELWTDKNGNLTRAVGKVTEITSPYILKFTWKESKWDYETKVHIRLREMGKNTLVEVTHNGWPEEMTDQMRSDVSRLYYGWRSFLRKLKEHASDNRP
jgi:uncharacterized protein YndB with AHSA1/START domain